MDDAEKILELPISYEERGIKQGIEKGKKEGRIKEKKDVALNMLKEKLSIELIARVTQLDKNEIEELKRKM